MFGKIIEVGDLTDILITDTSKTLKPMADHNVRLVWPDHFLCVHHVVLRKRSGHARLAYPTDIFHT